MRKANLPMREIAICRRLKEAREFLGKTQEECARQLKIERARLANYEYEKAPLRYELALRFCRQFVVSEEWLATGKFEAMRTAGLKHCFQLDTDWKSLNSIFVRQCMDILSEPVTLQVPPGTLFSLAYDSFFETRYAALAVENFYTPRILFTPHDLPELGINVLEAYVERWLKMLGNEAKRRGSNSWEVQKAFICRLIKAGGFLFKKVGCLPFTENEWKNLDWLRISLESSASTSGPLDVPETNSPEDKKGLVERG